MTPEGKVKAQVKAVIAQTDAWHVMTVPQGMGRRGIPDFLICHRGQLIAVETKAKGGTPTALQQRELNALGAAGAITLVVDGEETLNDLRRALCLAG
jgi:uncharacterized membrane protein YjjP (DUF1212 family)